MLTTRNVESLTVALVAAQRARDIGQRIRRRREALGYKQPQVADEIARLTGNLAVTKDYVSRWERGANEPDEDNLKALAKVLQTKVAYLMVGSPEEQAEQAERLLEEPIEIPATTRAKLNQIEAQLEALGETSQLVMAMLARLEAELLDGRAATNEEERAANGKSSGRKRRAS